MAKKMQRVIFTGLLSFFLVLVIALVPVFGSCAAGGEQYTESLQLQGANPFLYCKFVSYKGETADGYNIANFQGSDSSILSFTQSKGYRYNGWAEHSVTYSLPAVANPDLSIQQISGYLSYQVSVTGVHVSIVMTGRTNNSITFSVRIYFSDYVATFDGVMQVPFSIILDTSAFLKNPVPNLSSRDLYLTRSSSVDWYGDLVQYPYGGVTSGPGTGGTLIDQNDDIIANTDKGNQLQEQGNQLQQQQNQLVQNQTQQQHQDANNIMNGFDNTAGNAAGNQLDESLGSLESAEDNLFGNAGSMIDFDDYKSWLNLPGILSSAAFVSSILTLIHQYSGDFGVILIVGFILFIITRILGMQHFVGK